MLLLWKQWWIQDFPEVGAPTLRGELTYDFAKFSQKMHEIERNFILRGAHPKFCCVDPPLERLKDTEVNMECSGWTEDAFFSCIDSESISTKLSLNLCPSPPSLPSQYHRDGTCLTAGKWRNYFSTRDWSEMFAEIITQVSYNDQWDHGQNSRRRIESLAKDSGILGKREHHVQSGSNR